MTETTAVAVSQPHYAGVAMNTFGNGALPALQNMADVVSIAQLMAKSGVAVPKHLRDNPGGCLAVSLRALSWNADPFAVASKTFTVNDAMGYEAQLIAAVIIAHAPIKGRPKYTFTGAGGTRACKVEVVERSTGEVLDYQSPETSAIPTKNSPLWKADLDQQLGYYAIRALARRHFPDIILGMYDREELESIKPEGNGAASGVAARLEASQRPQSGDDSASGFSGNDVIKPGQTITLEVGSGGAGAKPKPEEEREEQSPDVNDEATVYPTTDQIHYLTSVPAAKNGTRQSFRNGKPHAVMPKGTNAAEFDISEEDLKAYFAEMNAADARIEEINAAARAPKEPEPVEEAEQEPAIRTSPEDRQEPAPEPQEPRTGVIGEIEKLKEWDTIKKRVAALYASEDFGALEPADQAEMRAAIFDYVITLDGMPTVEKDVSLFRLWIDTLAGPEDADRLEGAFEKLQKESGFPNLPPASQEKVRGVVNAALANLRG